MRHFLPTRVLALALLLTQLGSLAHLALIQHEDALDGGACTAAAHGIDEATEGARVELPAAPVALHTADGCAVLAHARVSVQTPAISAALPQVAVAVATLHPAELRPPAALSPLMVAPKSSPPARG